MVAQLNFSLPAFMPPMAGAERTDASLAAIEDFLRAQGSATAAQVANILDVKYDTALARLLELREVGIVRRVPRYKRSGAVSAHVAWALGMDEDVARAEQMKPRTVKAVQLGCFQRDPLVAALFGAGQPRCVSCQQPQGAPHSVDCMFNGVDIDVAHRRPAAPAALAIGG